MMEIVHTKHENNFVLLIVKQTCEFYWSSNYCSFLQFCVRHQNN